MVLTKLGIFFPYNSPPSPNPPPPRPPPQRACKMSTQHCNSRAESFFPWASFGRGAGETTRPGGVPLRRRVRPSRSVKKTANTTQGGNKKRGKKRDHTPCRQASEKGPQSSPRNPQNTQGREHTLEKRRNRRTHGSNGRTSKKEKDSGTGAKNKRKKGNKTKKTCRGECDLLG